MRSAEIALAAIQDRGCSREWNDDTGEPDALTRCKSGSEGGGWKRPGDGTLPAAYPTF
jgi:hypothetical protein